MSFSQSDCGHAQSAGQESGRFKLKKQVDLRRTGLGSQPRKKKNTVQQEQQVSGYRHLGWVVTKVDSEETTVQKVKGPHQTGAGKSDSPRSEFRSWKVPCLLYLTVQE